MTQRERLENYLREHRQITSKEAMDNLGVMRLSSQIYKLKKAGANIRTEMTDGTNRFGDQIRYATYILED